jgi:hypothetical protein
VCVQIGINLGRNLSATSISLSSTTISLSTVSSGPTGGGIIGSRSVVRSGRSGSVIIIGGWGTVGAKISSSVGSSVGSSSLASNLVIAAV